MSIKRWIGNAAATFDVWTISLSGTVTSQAYSVTINGKSITFVADGSDDVSSILAGLVATWTSLSAPPPPEFAELSPAVSGSTIVATGNSAGRPHTLTVATSGAATYSIAHTTTATGPNDFSNPLNWSTGSSPANSDTLVFDNGSTDCKYQLGTSLSGITLIVSQGYSGKIGLPFINTDGVTSYAEYRTTALTLAGGSVNIDAPNVNRMNLAFGANTATVSVADIGSRIDRYIPTILITGGDSSSILNIVKGDVGLAYYQGQTASFPTISTSHHSNALADVKLYCGHGTTLDQINKSGGELTINSDVTTLTQGVAGGTTYVNAGSVTALDLEEGTCVYDSTGTLGTATVSGRGTLDFGQSPAAKVVTNPIQLYGDNSSVNDPQKTVNAGTLEVTANQTKSINVNHGTGNVMSFA